MRCILLTGHSFSRVPAGVENYSQLLKKVFPSLEIISAEGTKAKKIPFVSEPFFALATASALEKKVLSFNPEIVFFNGMYGWALPKKTPYLKIGICHGTFSSFVRETSLSGLERIRTGGLYAFFEKKSLQNADIVIANSRATQERLLKDYGIASTVIWPAIDFRVFQVMDKKASREKLSLPPEKKVVLFVGRATRFKGFDIFESLAGRLKAFHFVSVTFPVATAKGIDCRGPVPNPELPAYYSAADTVLFPSLSEGFGLVILEALACQIPVISSAVGIAKELEHPLLTVCESRKPDDWEKCLLEALSKQKPAKHELEKEFGVERFASEYQTACQNALSARKKI